MKEIGIDYRMTPGEEVKHCGMDTARLQDVSFGWIRVCFSVTTEESVKDGDCAESGILDEIPFDCFKDMVLYLRERIYDERVGINPSQIPPGPGTWYTSGWDPSQGEHAMGEDVRDAYDRSTIGDDEILDVEISYHIHGVSQRDEMRIHNALAR